MRSLVRGTSLEFWSFFSQVQSMRAWRCGLLSIVQLELRAVERAVEKTLCAFKTLSVELTEPHTRLSWASSMIQKRSYRSDIQRPCNLNDHVTWRSYVVIRDWKPSLYKP